jgi:hypothetical protein
MPGHYIVSKERKEHGIGTTVRSMLILAQTRRPNQRGECDTGLR